MFSILSALVIDVTTVAHGTDGKSCAIILRMSCCGVSAESISIRDDGLNDATWRTISLPMLPAEPVIRMRFPRRDSATDSRSTQISSRGKRSSMLTSFKVGAPLIASCSVSTTLLAENILAPLCRM